MEASRRRLAADCADCGTVSTTDDQDCDRRTRTEAVAACAAPLSGGGGGGDELQVAVAAGTSSANDTLANCCDRDGLSRDPFPGLCPVRGPAQSNCIGTRRRTT